MKLLHCADLHIGSKIASSRVKTVNIRTELFAAFERILNIADEEKVDLLLIAGDFLELSDCDESIFRDVRNLLSRERKYYILLVAGNHDPRTAGSRYSDLFSDIDKMYFFKTEEEQINFPELDTTVYGYSFSSIYQREFRLPRRKIGEKESKISIGLVHGTIADSGSSNDIFYNELPKMEVAASGLDYLALGHIHKSNFNFDKPELQYKLGNTICLWPGCPQGRTFKEAGPKGVILAEFDGRGNSFFKFISCANSLFINSSIDITGVESDLELSELITTTLEERFDNFRNNYYQVELTGVLENAYKPDFESVHAHIARTIGATLSEAIKLYDSTRAAFDYKKISEEKTVRANFVSMIINEMEELDSKLAELRNQSEVENIDDEKNVLIQKKDRLAKALDYGLLAFEGNLDIDKEIQFYDNSES